MCTDLLTKKCCAAPNSGVSFVDPACQGNDVVGLAGCVPTDANLPSFQDFVTFIAGVVHALPALQLDSSSSSQK